MPASLLADAWGRLMSLSEEWLSTDALRDVAAEPVILRPYQTDAIARIDDSSS
jgi:hypothetical protein